MERGLIENPTVYLTYNENSWEFEVGNLYNFLISTSYLQGLFALPFNANSSDVGYKKEIYVRQNWKKSEITSMLWGAEFFQNSFDELLAILKSENQIDIFIATKKKEKFKLLDEKLGIDWDYNSLEEE